MKKSERELIRLFYQNIPTQAEKDAFFQVINSDRERKVRYLLAYGEGFGIDAETQRAILAAGSLTKEDRVIIFSGVIRRWIFSLLGL